MRDVTGPLKGALFQLLNGNVSAPVYVDYVPAIVNSVESNAYILITTVSNTDRSTFSSSNTNTIFQLNVYTREQVANPGQMRNILADEIYELIYPYPDSVLDMPNGFQNYKLELANDISMETGKDNQFIWLNRFISFRTHMLHG